MSTVVDNQLLTKGAPDYILNQSSQILTKSGQTVPLNDAHKKSIQK